MQAPDLVRGAASQEAQVDEGVHVPDLDKDHTTKTFRLAITSSRLKALRQRTGRKYRVFAGGRTWVRTRANPLVRRVLYP